MIYQILITNVFERKLPALSVTFLMLINLSGLFYSYILLTEILTMFLLIISVWFLIKAINKSSMQFLFIAGVGISAMILARFNTLPIIFVFMLIILLFKFERRIKIYGLN